MHVDPMLVLPVSQIQDPTTIREALAWKYPEPVRLRSHSSPDIAFEQLPLLAPVSKSAGPRRDPFQNSVGSGTNNQTNPQYHEHADLESLQCREGVALLPIEPRRSFHRTTNSQPMHRSHLIEPR